LLAGGLGLFLCELLVAGTESGGVAGGATTQGEQQKMTSYYYLSVEATGVLATVGINDVPLVVGDKPGSLTATEPVNLWLLPSDNRITVDLAWPSGKPVTKGSASVEAVLFLHDSATEVPTPKRVLARFYWPSQEIEEQYPYHGEVRIEGSIADPPPTTLWQDAAALAEPSEAERREVLAIVEVLRSALIGKRLEDAFAVLTYRYKDEARAEGKPFERVRETVLEMYEWLVGQEGGLTSTPLTLEAARFRIVGAGKVLLVDRRDGVPAIYLENENADLAFGIPVYVARIGGKWTVVR